MIYIIANQYMYGLIYYSYSWFLVHIWCQCKVHIISKNVKFPPQAYNAQYSVNYIICVRVCSRSERVNPSGNGPVHIDGANLTITVPAYGQGLLWGTYYDDILFTWFHSFHSRKCFWNCSLPSIDNFHPSVYQWLWEHVSLWNDNY